MIYSGSTRAISDAHVTCYDFTWLLEITWIQPMRLSVTVYTGWWFYMGLDPYD